MLTAVDLFAGAGGLSEGLRQSGFRVVAAVELDPISAESYRFNHPDTPMLIADVRKVTGPRLRKLANLRVGDLDLLTGCPPCQGFSTLQTRRRNSKVNDHRNSLIFQVLRLARSLRPRVVLIENVPGLASDHRFTEFCSKLQRQGYHTDYRILDATHFGVPQRRKRLVLIAMRGLEIPGDWSAHREPTRTVRDAIDTLPPAGASGDALHDFPERRSAKVMERIRATPRDGGSRSDLPPELNCPCHQRNSGYFDVYGRMAWDEVAPTITSGCHNPSRGRFLHPHEHRAITLREAALLQAFPREYEFDLSRGKEHVARQIGNAFPPRLIRPIAASISRVLQQHR